jgi:hypothetical protein
MAMLKQRLLGLSDDTKLSCACIWKHQIVSPGEFAHWLYLILNHLRLIVSERHPAESGHGILHAAILRLTRCPQRTYSLQSRDE